MTPSLRKNIFTSWEAFLIWLPHCPAPCLQLFPQSLRIPGLTSSLFLPKSISPLQRTHLHRHESVPHHTGRIGQTEFSPQITFAPAIRASLIFRFPRQGEIASPSSLLNCKGHISHLLSCVPEALLS